MKTPTRVVNIHTHPGDVEVFCARPSVWRNPYVVGVDGNKEQVLELFVERLRRFPALVRAARKHLYGKRLGCYCAPKACHCHIWALVVEGCEPEHIDVIDLIRVHGAVDRVTPPVIASLKPKEVFVFGSNLRGLHGKGSALVARQKFGAELHVGEGPTGRSYALPTKREPYVYMALDEVRNHVDNFIKYATNHPQLVFLVVEVGCKNAGFTPAQIAPMFSTSPENVHLPRSFWDVINKGVSHDV